MQSDTANIIIGLKTLAIVLKVGKGTIYEYMKLGMPGSLIAGKWHFHLKNIERWFEEITNERIDYDDEIPEENEN